MLISDSGGQVGLGCCSLGETDWTGDMGEACWLTLALNRGLSFIHLFTHLFNRFHQMLAAEVDQTQPCPQGVARTCVQIGGTEHRRPAQGVYARGLGAGREASFARRAGNQEELRLRGHILAVCHRGLWCEQRNPSGCEGCSWQRESHIGKGTEV